MKVLLLTTYFEPVHPPSELYQQESSYRLWQYLQENGVEAALARYDDLDFRMGTSIEISLRGQSIDQYDWIILRSATQLHQHNLDNTTICRLVAEYAQAKDIATLNGEHICHFPPNFDKLFQMQFYAQNGLPIPQTYFSPSPDKLFSLPFPLVRKPFTGSHGDRIELDQEAPQLDTTEARGVFFQEVLPDKTDYRVLVLGHKVLGAMRRRAAKGKFVANYSAGGLVEAEALDESMKSISLRLANILKLDFCGVDLMIDSAGDYKILEVNRFPEFNGFELATGLNVREALLRYLVSQL